jgi:hypothetical protein
LDVLEDTSDRKERRMRNETKLKRRRRKVFGVSVEAGSDGAWRHGGIVERAVVGFCRWLAPGCHCGELARRVI